MIGNLNKECVRIKITQADRILNENQIRALAFLDKIVLSNNYYKIANIETVRSAFAFSKLCSG